MKARAASGFSLFIKENMAAARAALGDGVSHKETMQYLAAQFKLAKSAGSIGGTLSRGARSVLTRERCRSPRGGDSACEGQRNRRRGVFLKRLPFSSLAGWISAPATASR
jgi:hypothetical protein